MPWNVVFGDAPLSPERRLALVAVFGAMDGNGELDFESGRWIRPE